jgi:serine/threonine protein kinase/tetratricopeptide (TPR) repeat protein
MSPDKSPQNLFNEALERQDAAERTRFLDDACGADAALRERVERLLRAHDEAGGFFSQPSKAPPPAGTIIIPPAEKPGDRIGRYKLLQQLGEGGCGVVYMAEQEEPVRRRVALKVIKLGMDTKQVIARFEAERQALALMDHPNIARVLDAGATDSGRPFFVMELVRGQKITEFCDQKQLSTRERLDLFLKVCSAVQHAHQKGVIHRDVKPSNILVTNVDGVAVPKVIDFGIAKATNNQPLTDKTLFTAFEQFIGTPAYMSPEQAELSGVDIDTRTDIYSLGVVLYELLTGGTPFDQKELLAAGLDEMRRTIREKEPPRPSNRLSTLAAEVLTTTALHRHTEPPKLIHAVRGDLDWIVMKCLEKDRARRYETANALAMDIRRHLDSQPVLARPPSRWYEFQRTVRRHKVGFAATAALILVLAVGVLASTWQAVRATRAEKLANDRLAEAEAISSFMTEVIQSPDPTRDGRTIQVVELLDRAAHKLETDLAGQPEQKAKLQARLGKTHYSLGLYREAIPLQGKSRDYYLANFGPEHTNTLNAMHNLANSYAGAGRREEALKMHEEVLALRRKVNGPEHPDTLAAMHNLANSYDEAGRRGEARKLQEEVLKLRLKVSGPEHPDTLSAMHNLANSYAEAGRRDEALKMREEVLTLRGKVNGPEHPETLNAMINLANSYADAGREDEALKMREEALTLCRKVNGPTHRDTLNAMTELANSYRVAGRIENAITLEEESLRLKRQHLSAGHSWTIESIENLAAWYEEADRKAEAEALRKEAAEFKAKVHNK